MSQNKYRPRIEREAAVGERNIRCVLWVPMSGERDALVEEFVGKWRYDVGQSNEEMIGRALGSLKDSLTLQRNKTSYRNSGECAAAQTRDDLRVKIAQRLAAGGLRPEGRSEIVAVIEEASDHERHYRLVPDFWVGQHGEGGSGLVWSVVYDVLEDGVIGCLHQRLEPGLSYNEVLACVGEILENMPSWVEVVSLEDVVRKAYDEARARKVEMIEHARLEKEAKEAETDRANRAEYAARQELLCRAVKGKRGKATIKARTDTDKEDEFPHTVEVSGVMVGPFLVHKTGEKDKVYTITHIQTGLRAGVANSLLEGKILADLLGARGNWDFTDDKKMDRETAKYGGRVSSMWMAQRWVALVTYLTQVSKTAENALTTLVQDALAE